MDWMEQMDGTENEAEGLKLEGFPTLLFYPANNKEPIEFSGERTVRWETNFLPFRHVSDSALLLYSCTV
jgi:hypothetical protein